MRKLVEDKSECLKPPIEPSLFIHEPSQSSCWLPSLDTEKIVIIVIDALRLDFVLPSSNEVTLKESAWFDKLTILNELTISNPEKAKLFHFIADPPTATTQRLSALASGTLPAFMEITSNFAETSFGSDNFLLQFLNISRLSNLHMYGDDTWLHLFPIIEERSKGKISGFHSFHLFDLNSVDDGVKRELFPTLQSGDFDVIIAHFLGVDHCGHKFGAAMPQCGDKLSEMDSVLRKVIKEIDGIEEKVSLIVFGDHGMTDNGDHGGNGKKEVSSALFSYSNSKTKNVDINFWSTFYEKVNSSKGRLLGISKESIKDWFFAKENSNNISSLSGSITQIDLTPTLSILAGAPIPFGNIGCIIPEMLVDMEIYDSRSITEARLENMRFLVEAIRQNAYQVKRFLNINMENHESGFSPSTLSPIISLLEDAERTLQSVNTVNDGTLYTADDLQIVYLKFNDFVLASQQHCRIIWASFDYISISLGVGLIAICVFGLLFTLRPNSKVDFMALVIGLFHSLGLLATSFITFEDNLTLFLLNSIIILQTLQVFYNGTLTRKQIMLTLFNLIMNRLASLTGYCREEQYPHCQTINHRNIPFTFDLATVTIILLTISSFIWISSLVYKNIPKGFTSITGYLHMLIIFLGLVTRCGWTWISESVGIEEGTMLESMMEVHLPRVLFIACISAMIRFRRTNFLFILSTTFLLSTFSRPFSAIIALILSISHYILCDELFTHCYITGSLFSYLSGMFMFFRTGHQMTITSLQWESSFIGFRQTIPLIAGILMTLNTFSGQIISTLTYILLFVKKGSLQDRRGIASTFLFFYLIQLLFTIIAACALMHHLMVWRIFTPRFLFQMISSLLAFIITLLTR